MQASPAVTLLVQRNHSMNVYVQILECTKIEYVVLVAYKWDYYKLPFKSYAVNAVVLNLSAPSQMSDAGLVPLDSLWGWHVWLGPKTPRLDPATPWPGPSCTALAWTHGPDLACRTTLSSLLGSPHVKIWQQRSTN